METNQKETLRLVLKPVGRDGYWELREKLNSFCKENFDILFTGAVRLKCHQVLEDDTPYAISINKTYIHSEYGLENASGHYCHDAVPPTREQLEKTVQTIQKLIDKASEDIEPPFDLEIINIKGSDN